MKFFPLRIQRERLDWREDSLAETLEGKGNEE